MMADEWLGISDSPTVSGDASSPAGLAFLSQRAPLFGCAAWLLLLAGSHGFAITRLLLPHTRLLMSEKFVCCFGTGLSALSLVTLCCGLAGQLNAVALSLPSGVSLLIAVFVRKRLVELPQNSSPLRLPAGASRLLAGLVLVVLVPFAIYLLLGSVSPPTDFDVREYHLQGPKEWFQQGQVTFLRHNVYTSFPFLSEMLCLAGMVVARDWWHGALVGQIVLACFQLLSTCAVFAIGRRWFHGSVAWLAALIYLTTPWTLRISLIAYAEGALTFYLIASTMAAMWMTTEPFKKKSCFIFIGVLAGSAMASKYTGLVSVIVPTAALLIFILWRRPFHDSSAGQSTGQLSGHPFKSHAIAAGCFVLGIAIVMTPWLLRNLADTGNPVYPLGYSVFGGKEWSPEMNARWKPAHAPSEHHLVEIPRHFLDAAVRNTWTSGLLFSLGIPAVLLWRRLVSIRILICLITWEFFTWWALTHRIDRFWIPVIPLMSVAAASCWLLSERKIWRIFLGAMLSAGTLYNVYFCGLALVGFHVGLMDLDAARQLVIRSDVRALNQSLPSQAKALMVGDAEVFDAVFPLVYSTVFDDCLFEEWTSDPADARLPVRDRRMLPDAEIRSRLAAEGITHVVVHWGEILRYRLPGSYGYTEYVQPSRFQSLVTRNILTSPRTLLARPLESLSPSELAVIQSWNDYQSLLAGDAFSVVQVFQVVSESEK